MTQAETIIQFTKVFLMLIGLAFFIIIGIKVSYTMDRAVRMIDIYEVRTNIIK